MAAAILPNVKAIYLCEEIDEEGGMTNIYALFNAIRPDGFPHTQNSFICFAQLLGGMGDVPFHIDVKRAADSRLINCSNVHRLRFPNRDTLLQLSFTMKDCVFDSPGVYLIELYCDNIWIGDTTLQVREKGQP